MQRTYSRKGANRRNRLSDRLAPVSSDSDSEHPEPPAKRQRLSPRQDESSQPTSATPATNSQRGDKRSAGTKAPGTSASLTHRHISSVGV